MLFFITTNNERTKTKTEPKQAKPSSAGAAFLIFSTVRYLLEQHTHTAHIVFILFCNKKKVVLKYDNSDRSVCELGGLEALTRLKLHT